MKYKLHIIQHQYAKEAADVVVNSWRKLMAKNTNREVVKLGIRTWNWPLYQQEE